MKFSVLCETYSMLEATTKRLEMTDILVDLLKNCDKAIIDKVCYLSLGRIYPEYVDLELGLAEKMVAKTVAMASGISQKEVEKHLAKTGDLGTTVQELRKKGRAQTTLFAQELTVERVFETLDKIARSTGTGSQDRKVKLLASLLLEASPLESKYIVRIVLGQLRLGVADMTILDALAIAYGGGKESREIIERSYHLSSDVGAVAKALAERGLGALKSFKIQVGTPIHSMLAQRLSSPEEILEKLGGVCALEFKFDGERIQAHKKGEEVLLFSRRLENVTHQFPDIQILVRDNIKTEKCIVEGEIVAINPETGEMYPFQVLMQRRRKYGIKEAMEKIPTALFLFDCLYVDGKDFTVSSYVDRRKQLEKIVKKTEQLQLSEKKIGKTVKEIEKFFEQSIEYGCEGIMAKSIDGVYQAGARGWLWIKYKRDYRGPELTDTLDLVVVGAFYGRGRRGGTYGTLLMAGYEEETDMFKTVCKLGAGFSDENLEELPRKLKKHLIPHKHSRIDSNFKADVWFEPALVLEVQGSELTLSPTHTAAWDKIKKDAGLAVRFPRFTGRFREDKTPEQATTTAELEGMYKAQLKQIEK